VHDFLVFCIILLFLELLFLFLVLFPYFLRYFYISPYFLAFPPLSPGFFARPLARPEELIDELEQAGEGCEAQPCEKRLGAAPQKNKQYQKNQYQKQNIKKT